MHTARFVKSVDGCAARTSNETVSKYYKRRERHHANADTCKISARDIQRGGTRRKCGQENAADPRRAKAGGGIFYRDCRTADGYPDCECRGRFADSFLCGTLVSDVQCGMRISSRDEAGRPGESRAGAAR